VPLERMMLTANIYSFRRSFHQDLHPLLLFACFFGIMPINISNHSSMKTKLLSFRMIYCLLIHVLVAIMLFTLIYFFVSDQNFDYGKLVPVIFFFNCFAIAINFVYIARRLPQLMDSWSKVEAEFDDEERDVKSKLTSSKILAIFMTVSFIEHFSSKVVDYERATYCFDVYPRKFEAISRGIIPAFFQLWQYTHSFGFYVIITCFLATVLWNFCDIFLIIIFYVTFTKLKKFNRKISKMKFQNFDEKFWLRTRLNYVGIHEQVKTSSHVSSCLLCSMIFILFAIKLWELSSEFTERQTLRCDLLLIFSYFLQTLSISATKHLFLVFICVSYLACNDCVLECIANLSGD
jgi:hypothetical protein